MKFEDAPRLSKLPFVLGNVALLALAWFIYTHHPNPFSPLPLFIIFVCFVVGILASIYPYVVNHVRDQADSAIALRHEMDEQFKRLAAASEHLQNSVIQLKSIEATVASNVESAKNLPSILQDKIGEVRRQLNAKENDERIRLEQELTRLRSGESDRQASAANQISTALAEWTRLEADARRSFADLVQREKNLFAEQVVALQTAENDRLGAAAGAITATLNHWTEIQAGVSRQLEEATDVQQKLGSVLSALDGKIADLQSVVDAAAKAAQVIPMASLPLAFEPSRAQPEVPLAAGPAADMNPSPISIPETPPEPEPAPAIEQAAENPAAAQPLELPATIPHVVEVEGAAPEVPHVEPSDSIALEKPRRPRAPRKPRPEAPAPAEIAAEPGIAPAPAEESPIVHQTPMELIVEPVADDAPAPDDFSQTSPDESKPPANASADGHTRLTVVSYIGIGNKLHIRGDGAGLNWGKGLPLQFVSIGRWRWETDKATAPVSCRIYKNDKLEAPIGPLTLLPGTEQEVSVMF